MPWKRRRRWTGDAHADHGLMDICEQEINFLWVSVPNNDELDADAVPFQPRFLLQEIIFAHCPYFPSRASEENLLCRADWLCLGGIAGCECAILPIPEIATHSRCEHASSGERPTARRSLPAPEPVNKICWQLAESQQDNGRSEWRSDKFDADTVPFQPRLSLQELIFAHCPHQPRSRMKLSVQSGLALS